MICKSCHRGYFSQTGNIVDMARRLPVLMMCGSLLAGCGSMNPLDIRNDAEVATKARSDADAEIRFSGPGNWYQNFKGFSLLHPLPRSETGIIVVTDKSVSITGRVDRMPWLIGTGRTTIQDLGSVELASYGLNRRVVLCRKDLRCDSFDFTKPNGITVDALKVEDAAAYLRGVVATTGQVSESDAPGR